ncbi:SGNH hydrolase-type esterase domain-containing protein [Obelidium mucronatum]|nr:SGNH hydrolase-type esterase domain-containing protein [Obelidium mucronatum]
MTKTRMAPAVSLAAVALFALFSLLFVSLQLPAAKAQIRLKPELAPKLKLAPEQTAIAKNHPLAYDSIVLLGDSLTEYDGWGASVASRYKRKMSVFNRGFSGYNSYWLNFLIDPLLQDIPPSQIKLVTLLIGTNDSVPKGKSNQHVSLDRYKRYLAEIIRKIQKGAPNAKLLILTPPPISETQLWDSYFFSILFSYRNACIEVAMEVMGKNKNNAISLLDTWDLFIPGRNYIDPLFDPTTIDDYFQDKLHLSEHGGKVLYEGITNAIKKKWPHLDADQVVAPVPMGFNDGPADELGDDKAVKVWLGLL